MNNLSDHYYINIQINYFKRDNNLKIKILYYYHLFVFLVPISKIKIIRIQTEPRWKKGKHHMIIIFCFSLVLLVSQAHSTTTSVVSITEPMKQWL